MLNILSTLLDITLVHPRHWQRLCCNVVLQQSGHVLATGTVAAVERWYSIGRMQSNHP